MKSYLVTIATCCLICLFSINAMSQTQEPPIKLILLKNGQLPEEPYNMNLDDELTLKIQNPTHKEFQFTQVTVGLVFGYHQQIQQRKDNTQFVTLETPQFSREPQLQITLMDLFDKSTIYENAPTQLIITVYNIKERIDGIINQATNFTLGKEYVFWIMDSRKK